MPLSEYGKEWARRQRNPFTDEPAPWTGDEPAAVGWADGEGGESQATPPSPPSDDETENDTPELVLTRLSDVMPERVSWLWQGRIPAGKLVVLDGDPNVGKSTLGTAFAGIVSAGGRWPDGTACPSGDVLILSAEDGLADTIRPRLDAAGADLTRVHASEGRTVIDVDGHRVLEPLTLADIKSLSAAIRSKGARLLVVDVLMAYIPASTDAHKDQDIRRVLSRLAALAERTGCTVLLLRHLNKNTGRNPLYRGGGSIGIGGAARAVLLAAFDPDDPERRVLASVKNNLAPTPPSLAFALVPWGTHGAARVLWEGESAHTARALLADPDADDEPAALTEAERWLEDYVMKEGGSVKSADAKKTARKDGIADRTLQRAAKKLKLVVESHGYPRTTYWTWPTSGAMPPGTQNLGATGATGADQQKHGGATESPNPQSRQSRQGFVPGATEAQPCGRCGAELTEPESIARGFCTECALSANTPQTPQCINVCAFCGGADGDCTCFKSQPRNYQDPS